MRNEHNATSNVYIFCYRSGKSANWIRLDWNDNVLYSKCMRIGLILFVSCLLALEAFITYVGARVFPVRTKVDGTSCHSLQL